MYSSMSPGFSMRLYAWDYLPDFVRNEDVRPYYDILFKKRKSLAVKRGADIFLSLLLIVALLPFMLVLAVWIRLDSNGPALFRQIRITQYGREYKILKLRTMTHSPPGDTVQITINGDHRLTRAGKHLRQLRLDELPQLFNILSGDMTFVGTRPEVPEYVKHYTKEMMATLLMPAGLTSKTSLLYRDEALVLEDAGDAEQKYLLKILPRKMMCNLESLKNFSLWSDITTMLRTVFPLCQPR
ncbi:MAG: sugar transferase [Oscillospiraceae bacterium]|nr:sugar transferase [Oscillospiraceae bacterium]